MKTKNFMPGKEPLVCPEPYARADFDQFWALNNQSEHSILKYCDLIGQFKGYELHHYYYSETFKQHTWYPQHLLWILPKLFGLKGMVLS